MAWVAETVRWLDTPRTLGANEVRAGLVARIPEYQPAGSSPAIPISPGAAAIASARPDRVDADSG
jgi:hypothetical protein